MKILIAYATYSSSTKTVTELIYSILKDKYEVTHKLINEVNPDELNSYDFILFASPSWWNREKDGQPHEFFLAFMDQMEGKTLPDKRFAIVGCGDEKYTHFCGAVDVLEEFVKKLGGKLVVDSMRIDGFYFNQPLNEQKIAEWTQKLISQL